jgi:hypothetical protein
MGYTLGSIDQKQHINLSEYAWDTINNDVSLFIISKGLRNNISGFLNTIFQNYYEFAKASISFRLEEKSLEIKNILDKDTFIKYPSNLKEDLLKSILKNYQYDLLNYVENLPKGLGKKFRINNNSYDILELDDDCRLYNNIVGKYLKGIFEEYASLSFTKRELIYFRGIVDQVELSIKLNVKMYITLDNNRIFLISPLRIQNDNYANYNYLICEATSMDEPEKKPSFATFRLSRIKKARVLKSKRSTFTSQKKKEIEQVIKEKGVQFLSLESNIIKVRLNERGIRKYNSQIYLRPKLIEIENDNVFIFDCTELQIIYYFFKFGEDAVVLSPKRLVDSFRNNYRNALINYKE